MTLPDSAPAAGYTTLRYEDGRRLVVDPAVRARRKVIVLDCCYSGRALVGGMSAGEHVADQAVVEGTYLLTASAETRKALAPPGEGYTAFTGELVEMLSRGVPDGPELLDPDTVYRRLRASPAAKSRPLPQARNRNTGGLIALARNLAHRRPTASGTPPREPVAVAASDVVRTGAVPLREVWEGAHRLADVVGRTLGPAGSVVVLGSTTTADPQRICAAVTIDDRWAGLGADLVRSLVGRMRGEWSDGAATAVVMADSMMATVADAVAAGVHPACLSAELATFAETVSSALRRSAVEVGTKEQIALAVRTATADATVGDLLAEALDRVGREGVIVVEPLDAEGLELELRDGMYVPSVARRHPGDFPEPVVAHVRVALGPAPPAPGDGRPVLEVAVRGAELWASLGDREGVPAGARPGGRARRPRGPGLGAGDARQRQRRPRRGLPRRALRGGPPARGPGPRGRGGADGGGGDHAAVPGLGVRAWPRRGGPVRCPGRRRRAAAPACRCRAGRRTRRGTRARPGYRSGPGSCAAPPSPGRCSPARGRPSRAAGPRPAECGRPRTGAADGQAGVLASSAAPKETLKRAHQMLTLE